MKEFIARWQSESPEYFKAIGRFGKWLAISGGMVMSSTLLAPETISESVIGIVKLVSSYMIFGGGVIAALCQLPVTDYDKMKEKMSGDKNSENQNQ